MKLQIEYKKLKAGLKKETINPAEVTDLTLWDFSNESDLSFLGGMVNLRRLDAGMRWGKDLDLGRITACKNLEELDFNNDDTTDLSWLADLPKLKVLRTSGNSLDYQTLPRMSQLEALYFGDEDSMRALPDYSILERVPNLRALLIGSGGLNDLRFLSYVPNLESLSISDSGYDESVYSLSDISHLSACPNLQSLDMKHFDAVDDISVVSNLKKLKKLKLYHLGRNNKKICIGPIGNLSELECLSIQEAGTMDGYHTFAALKKLRHLVIECLYDKKLKDLEFLRGLVELRHLGIRGQTLVNDLDPLRSLTELEVLDIGGINEGIRDFSALNKLTKLREVCWYGCARGKYLKELDSAVLTKLNIRAAKYIDNLEVISHLANLEELDMSRTNIKSLKGSEGLGNLRRANFEECKRLSSLGGIEKCTALEELYISDCSKIKDLSLLDKNKLLKRISMYRCRVDLNTLPKRKGLEFIS